MNFFKYFFRRIFCKHKNAKIIYLGYHYNTAQCQDCGKKRDFS